MTTDAVAGRRRARRNGGGEPASLALSLLDIVSAGFGAAVFLFVVFAALPLGEPRPGGGGGSSFIDLRLEWDRPRIEPNGAPATDITEKLNELSEIYADWRMYTHMSDDGNKLEHSLRAEVYGTETKLRETLKIHLNRIEPSVAEELKFRTENLGIFLTPYLDATCSNLFEYQDSFSAFLNESPHFGPLCRIFGVDHIGQPPADRRDRPMPIYYPAEPSAPDPLKFVADYARELYDEEQIITIFVDVKRKNETLNGLPHDRPFASLSASAANDGSPAAVDARTVDPKLSVQIIYDPPGENRRIIALTGPKTRIDPETDALALKSGEEAPWDAAFVTGYDFYGNYGPFESSAERELFVRILNPAPGEWSFRATVLDRDGTEAEFPGLGLRAALTCPDTDVSVADREEEVIPLYPPEHNVIEIPRSPCRVTGSG